MPFHFKKKESMPDAIWRLCRERVDAALDYLKAGGPQAVHNVRREIKKLRSILRLVRGEIGESVYRKNTVALRTAAKRLTALRDAQMELNTFEKLAGHFGHKLSARTLSKMKKALQKNCRAEERKFLRDGSIRAVNQILRKLKRRAGNWAVKSNDWAVLETGLKKTYCRGRETLETVREKPLPENFHEWRKRVKDLWHELRLLGPARPKRLRMAVDELEMLGKYLGDDHDLVMLEGFLASRLKAAGDADKLNESACSRQRKLRAAALKLGGRFYSEKPDRFCRRIGNYWRIWRGEK